MREMKDSGIEWIGDIPASWETRKIKQLADSNTENSFVDGDWIESPYIVDCGIRYLTTGNIGDGVFKEQGNGYITLKTFEELACKYAFPGDLIISRLNAPYGRSCILPSDYTEYVVAVDNVILRTQEDKRYICYVSQCDGYKHTVEDDAKGTTMKRISRTNLGNIVIPLPPIQQQCRIADYLDRKCSQIDAIITRQQEVIEKLKAYKLSVITEAVTKGLNPDVPMKDSGVEWIGEIPEHWNLIKATRIIISTQNGLTRRDLDKSTGQIVLKLRNISSTGEIDYEYQNRIELTKQELDTYRLKEGDFLFVRVNGSKSLVGKCTIFHSIGEDVAYNDHIIRVRISEKCIPKFFFWFLLSICGKTEIDLHTSTSAGQYTISGEGLRDIRLVLPPKAEQLEIDAHLSKICSSIDKVIFQKQTSIDKFTAYKKSLIYEVVTGKKEV